MWTHVCIVGFFCFLKLYPCPQSRAHPCSLCLSDKYCAPHFTSHTRALCWASGGLCPVQVPRANKPLVSSPPLHPGHSYCSASGCLLPAQAQGSEVASDQLLPPSKLTRSASVDNVSTTRFVTFALDSSQRQSRTKYLCYSPQLASHFVTCLAIVN